jgi:hypothetical protein
MSIDVVSKIQIFDNDKGSSNVGEFKFAEISSVWNRKDLAKVVVEDKVFFVRRSDLTEALKNAGNTNNYI